MSRDSPEEAGTRILIVEDNRRHAELITDEVRDSGVAVDVDWASTGRQGLSLLETARVDLILLDYRLPDMDGIGFMQELRARGYGIPVIFVTTADSVGLAVQAMKLGAEDFLQKQEGYLEVLPLLVREAIERHRLRAEKTRLEQQLRQSERLASLGILAAGLAHNINNRLTSLKTFFELLPTRRDDPAMEDEFIEICRQDLDKIVLLVQELTRYAFSDESPRPPEPLADLVLRAIGHLDDEIRRKRIHVRTEFADVPQIPLEAEGVKQLFINLVKNAIQASPHGGELRITISRDGEHEIVATVEDQGPGLPQEMRDKIFDPFFTTKDHGLGIGLYICHKIAAQHRGRIEVGSRPQGGAVFSVRLPIPKSRDAPGSRHGAQA